MIRVAIVGAGLSALSLAHLLGNRVEVTLFEKARGVSGRMSTRRAEPHFFDHGAQYFTARTKPFQKFIQPFIDEGVIQKWSARYARFDDNRILELKDWENDEPRYVGSPAMNSFAKALSLDLDITLNTRIVSLDKEKNGVWRMQKDIPTRDLIGLSQQRLHHKPLFCSQKAFATQRILKNVICEHVFR